MSAGGVQRRLRSERARLKAPRTCRSCGSQLAKVLDSGKVGCSQCYKIFHEEIDPMLAALHGGTQHRGKTSRVRDVRAKLRTDLQTKRSLLRSALETENYEEAAALRDDIKQLEMVLGASLTGSMKEEG
jgi:protein arginine kinase activator